MFNELLTKPEAPPCFCLTFLRKKGCSLSSHHASAWTAGLVAAVLKRSLLYLNSELRYHMAVCREDRGFYLNHMLQLCHSAMMVSDP